MKELYMQQMEQGWQGVGDKHVCPNCINDYAIQDFIRDNAVAQVCSYCGREEDEPIAAHMDEVIPFIADGINSEYEDPANSVGYESAEGGYLLPTMDGDDLIGEVGLDDSQEDVFEDLCDAFRGQLWVHQDPYGDLQCDALRYNWDAFAKLVKHRTRFVFFRLTTEGKMSWEPEPHEILDSLHSIVMEVGLVKTLPAETKFLRAHLHEPAETLAGAARLGSPPPPLASHSRMSPAGIPMLYVADDAMTAAAEVTFVHPTRTQITIAEFTNLRPLRILDLNAIPRVPSLFDQQNRHQRMPLIFLHDFADEISKPISDAAKSYEYVPTQVMTEYFRHLFHMPTERSPHQMPPLDGLAFRSSRNGGGINYTLFLDQESCADNAAEAGAVMLLRNATSHAATP
jgi:hypothetical protein